MVFKCCEVGCATGKTKEESVAVFSFPDKESRIDSWKAWVKLVNWKDFLVTKNTGVCEKHFEERFIRKKNAANTLIQTLNPIPISNNILKVCYPMHRIARR